jgi:hypothetical protein
MRYQRASEKRDALLAQPINRYDERINAIPVGTIRERARAPTRTTTPTVIGTPGNLSP